ncbi:MAG: sigma 54-interacting transcriptional regulator [Pseudomonadota bacterium]|nr:sigma 54-interacting transcriptional regulator [Pseudomonadota bacterium]
MSEAHIVLADDDPELLRLLSIRLIGSGYRVSPVESGEKALSLVARERPDLVITDLRMGGMDGMALFEAIRNQDPALPVIILTAHATVPDAVEAVHRGVFGYLTKPYDSKILLAQVERALAVTGRGQESAAPGAEGATARAPKSDGEWRAGLITRSQRMESLLSQARLAAESEAAIFIQGESGTGKELLAQAIHRASRRRDGAFIAVNCGAIPENLLESELFGHVKGAFTGATRDHEGLFVAADGGTLFLDEVGDMPLSLQVKLLRVLQEREVRPVGATQTRRVNVRVLSATHRNLEQRVAEGTFRDDLYYRLNVVKLEVPPLRERREDIPLLAMHFLRTLGEHYGRRASSFAPDAMQVLLASSWPGNVRQLYNVVERSLALSTTDIIPDHLVQAALQGEARDVPSFDEARRGFERDYLVQVLKMANGNVSHAARLAKRNRTEFYKLLQKHELEPNSFKPAD